jgi:Holliday junction resolvase RusA-like endonuclease
MYPSKPYTHWKVEADRYLLQQKGEGLRLPDVPWGTHLSIETRLNPPDKRRRDLDNVGAKAILDRMVEWGVIMDDVLVQKIVMMWDHDTVSPGNVYLTIWR